MDLFKISLKGNRIFFFVRILTCFLKLLLLLLFLGMDVFPQLLQGKERETERQNVSKSPSQAHSSAQHFFFFFLDNGYCQKL